MTRPPYDVDPPLVTIAIPTLNRPETCRLAIESALQQSGIACRILVSENASSPEFAARYDAMFRSLDGSVDVLRQPVRLPVEDHFASLVRAVSTRYVVLLADDDVLAASFVARAMALAESHGHAAVFGPYRHEWKATGVSRLRSYDYSGDHALTRAAKFIGRRNDSFIYGLFRTALLDHAMREFRPLTILGRRTLTRIAYAPLLSVLLAGTYGHLHGEAVWVSAVDSAKNEAYLGASNIGKLVFLVLGEVVLANRFLRVASHDRGPAFAALLVPLVLAMAVVESGGFVWLAARRFCAALAGRARSLVRR
jgi:glycosyltransferase involved in cell wall biosynthesis